MQGTRLGRGRQACCALLFGEQGRYLTEEAVGNERCPDRSQAALTYEEAQTRMDDERLQDTLSRSLRRLNQVAKVLRQRRQERGALTLASAEVKFEIDTETHDPLDVGMYLVSLEVPLPECRWLGRAETLKRELRSVAVV